MKLSGMTILCYRLSRTWAVLQMPGRKTIYCGAGWAVGQVSVGPAGLWAKSVWGWPGCGPSQCGAGWAVGQVSAVLARRCMLDSFSLLIIYLQIHVSI